MMKKMGSRYGAKVPREVETAQVREAELPSLTGRGYRKLPKFNRENLWAWWGIG
jgi:hypothetical protein